MTQKNDTKEKPDGVTETKHFAATITRGPDGKKTVTLKSPRWYRYQISKFKDGEDVTLVIHSRKPKRTEQQNRYYWGAFLPKVAEETGESDLDKLHELFKGKFLTEGIVEVLGEKVRMKKSTTNLSKADFSEYISSIEALTGVTAPPTENWSLPQIHEEPE